MPRLGEGLGCRPVTCGSTAVADGYIVRAEDGAVIQDLDNDGYEQTGWTVLYYAHRFEWTRRERGRMSTPVTRIGHPSCEGGVSNATHLHIARRYNGEWIPADGPLPFIMDGWVSSGEGIYYDGYLTRGATSPAGRRRCVRRGQSDLAVDALDAPSRSGRINQYRYNSLAG
ncbi:MAG: hypothetical protein MZV64_24045 [Ignavibacteriales bacterium]|nr:hypothetical protein [Ignavibacteriales bacterium]